MKKHLMAALLAIAMCLVAFSGCSLVSGLERDVQVVLKVNGEYKGTYTVNAFNNAVVPVPDAPEGLIFYGWTAEENWEEQGAQNVRVTANKGLIRYDDVKDWIKNDELSVTLYPVFGEPPYHDVAIAWYNKEKTSGLNQSIIDGFTTELYGFLKTSGKNPEEMDIVIRSYEGNVGPTCEAIKNDADIDIMLGWKDAENLTGTGGMKPGKDFVENNFNIFVNPDFKDPRGVAKLVAGEETVDLVYDWILDTYAGEGGATLDYQWDGKPVDPEEPDEPEVPDKPQSGIKYTVGADDDLTFKVACYGVFNTSGFTDEIKANFEAGLKAALKECGASDEQLAQVEVEFYCYKPSGSGSADDNTNIAGLGDAIEADGGADILLGARGVGKSPYLKEWSKTGLTSKEMTIGSINDRYVITSNKKGLTVAIYDWILSAEGLALLATPTV